MAIPKSERLLQFVGVALFGYVIGLGNGAYVATHAHDNDRPLPIINKKVHFKNNSQSITDTNLNYPKPKPFDLVLK